VKLKKVKILYVFLSLLFFIVACSPIRLNDVNEKQHFVRPGETLMVIAWRYGLNYQDLISWNKISNTDLIIPGQIIELTPPLNYSRKKLPSSRDIIAANKPIDINDKKITWILPTNGKVLRKFSRNSNFSSGILIGGTLGQSISAASDGRIVYAGDGLIGYGQLIIIEHSNVYLSAYGYNQTIIVSEGDLIKKGQKIATMGLSSEQSPGLYFEIRRSTTPIDPIQFINKS
jgi:lipoprotein NlpD